MTTWLDQMFDADQVDSGGVIRRKKQAVLKHTSISAVVKRAKAEGWHVLENGDQLVVLCNPGVVKIHC